MNCAGTETVAHATTTKRTALFARTSVALLTLVLLHLTSARAASSEKPIHSFPVNSGPIGGLVADSAGNLYGTTSQGGKYLRGSVFELIAPAKGSSHWKEITLYSFTETGGDGGEPGAGSLVFDAKQKNLYGTTELGGSNNLGTVFRLSLLSNGKWRERVIANFSRADGFAPGTSVIMDAKGKLYGATSGGGAYEGGTVFQLVPAAGGTWTFNLLYAFTGGKDGAYPGWLTLIGKNLYGGATFSTNGAGLIFELTPSTSGPWTETTLYDFSGGSDGSGPKGPLVMDKSGNFYGATILGGASNDGTVFKLAHSGSTWTESVLYSFTGGSDGSRPEMGPIFDSAGNLYGTTAYGGEGGCSEGGGCGAVYKLASGTWTESTLWEFTGGSDGGEPFDALILLNSELYGTTYYGGPSNGGVVFEVKP
jgi:uncharacterized repeat protein (TIGR03803 family)